MEYRPSRLNAKLLSPPSPDGMLAAGAGSRGRPARRARSASSDGYPLADSPVRRTLRGGKPAFSESKHASPTEPAVDCLGEPHSSPASNDRIVAERKSLRVSLAHANRCAYFPAAASVLPGAGRTSKIKSLAMAPVSPGETATKYRRRGGTRIDVFAPGAVGILARGV